MMIDPQIIDPQIRAADPALSVFVTANAGSGKTTTLVNRVARLLLDGVSPGAILCVTYTKAAAAEMQARLFEQLGDWAVLDDRALATKVAALDGRDPDGLSGEDLSRARRLFARALETPGGLKIQTIHAFCEKLLRRFPLEAGVSPRFTVLEDAAATELSKRARDDLARAARRDSEGLLGAAYSHFAVELDWARFEALLAMIEAKRADLADYVARIADGAAPDPYALTGAAPGADPAVIAADFLNWLRPTDWLEAANGFDTGSANDQKIARQMRACVPPATTLDAMTPLFFDSKGVAREKFGTKKAPPAAAGYLAEVQLKYLATLDQLRAARIADETVKVLTLAVAHAGLYEQAKAERGALDFPDLVAKTVELLTERSTAAWVLYKLDGGVEHILIDEAQDTAPEQWAIVRALTGEFFASEANGRTVFAVGDEKQSIYSFQGARPEQLRRQSQVYDQMVRAAGAAFEGVPLETSYRSTPEVLAFVDAVFQTPERTRALVGEEGFIPHHIAARQGHSGAIDLIPLFVDEKAGEREAWDDPVDQESATSGRKRLAAFLANDIRRQVETGATVYDRSSRQPRPCGYGDFLILVRRRDATFEEIIRALKTAGVPVAGADRLRLSSHIAFDDMKAVARFVLFPDDDLSLAEVLRSPFCDVDEDSLFELAGRDPKRKGLWRTLCERSSERPEWARARAFFEAALNGRDQTPFAFFAGLLNRVDETGLSGRARVLARLGREAEEALDETLNQALAVEGRGGVDLETGLSLLEAADVEVKRELEGPRGEVRVMTVHGAKGLEAPIVILPDTTAKAKAQGPSLMPVEVDGHDAWLMAPGSGKLDCPASAEARQARQDRADAESLRLLYVALTRARDRIVVMGRRAATRGPDEGSWWSVIAETFERLDADGKVRTLDGDIQRIGADPDTLPAARAADSVDAAVPDWARHVPAQDAAARYASPSRMMDKGLIPAPSPLARLDGADGTLGLGRFRRGDLIHRLLERLPEITPEDRPDAAIRLLARERDLSDEQRAEMIAAAFAVLDDPVFAPVFGPGSRAEVALRGHAPGLPSAISGKLDRLVITPERVLVVDYKTNRPAPFEVEKADPAYVLQLALYVAVLRRLYPDRPVEAALVWTDGPKLMAVPQGLMDAALEEVR